MKLNGTNSAPQVQLRLESALKSAFGETPLSEPDHAWRDYGLTIRLERSEFKAAMGQLKSDPAFLFDMLVDVTCVDWLDAREPRFDVVYQLLSTKHFHRLCIKVAVDEDKCEIDSVRDLWAAANFLEREAWDMYGVVFKGHGDLRRILMYDEFVGHPLRKDYPLRGKQPRVPLRIPELRNDSGDMRREALVQLPSKRPSEAA